MKKIATGLGFVGLLAACAEQGLPPVLELARAEADHVEYLTAHALIPEWRHELFAAPPGGAMKRRGPPVLRALSIRVSPAARELVGSQFEALLETECPDLMPELLGGSDRGAVDMVIAGLADAAVVVGEISAEQRDRGACSVVLGHHVVVLATQQGSPVRSLTNAQVRGLLNGSVRSWQKIAYQRGAIEVLLGPEGQRSSRSRRLLIAGDPYAPGAVRTGSEQEVLDRVSVDPLSVGVVSLASLDQQSGARAIAVNGVRPDAPGFEAGWYPHGFSVRLVYSCNASPKVREVLEVVGGPACRRHLGFALSTPRR